MPNNRTTQTEPDLFKAYAITLKDHCAHCGKPAPAYCSWFFEALFCGQDCFDGMMHSFSESGGATTVEKEEVDAFD